MLKDRPTALRTATLEDRPFGKLRTGQKALRVLEGVKETLIRAQRSLLRFRMKYACKTVRKLFLGDLGNRPHKSAMAISKVDMTGEDRLHSFSA